MCLHAAPRPCIYSHGNRINGTLSCLAGSVAVPQAAAGTARTRHPELGAAVGAGYGAAIHSAPASAAVWHLSVTAHPSLLRRMALFYEVSSNRQPASLQTPATPQVACDAIEV